MAFIRGILDRIVLVVSVITAGCFPSFVAQYRQRVGGMLDQVLKDIAPFQQIADQFHHGSLKELIQHHLASDDKTFYMEGTALQAMLDSVERLRNILQALDTDLFHQMAYLLMHADPLVARATWDIFSPSFTLTAESIVFAAVAGILVWLVFLAIWMLFARLIGMLTAK